MTCNALVKWAAGIADTLPLGLLVEAIGKHQPVVAANDHEIGYTLCEASHKDAVNRVTKGALRLPRLTDQIFTRSIT